MESREYAAAVRCRPPSSPAWVFVLLACEACAGDDETPAPAANALENGDFERGCTGWEGVTATFVPTETAHGGKKACLVCSNSTGLPLDFFQRRTLASGHYVGEVYVRAADGGKIAQNLSCALEALDADGHSVATATTPGPTLTIDWQRASCLVDLPAGDGMVLRFGAKATDGCLLIDDAALRLAPP